jgi:hypothetical protein
VCLYVCAPTQAIRLCSASPPPPRIALNTMAWSVTMAMLTELGRLASTVTNPSTGTLPAHTPDTAGDGGDTAGDSGHTAGDGGHTLVASGVASSAVDATRVDTLTHPGYTATTTRGTSARGATRDVGVFVRGLPVVIACRDWAMDPSVPVEDLPCRPGEMHAHRVNHANAHKHAHAKLHMNKTQEVVECVCVCVCIRCRDH